MAMIPYMVGGYAADRLMGGSGYTGLALGTGFGGLQTGLFGAEGLGLGLEPITMSDIGFTTVGENLAATGGGDYLAAYNAPIAGLDYPAIFQTADTAMLGDVGLTEPLFAGVNVDPMTLDPSMTHTLRGAGGLSASNVPSVPLYGQAFQGLTDISGKDLSTGLLGYQQKLEQEQALRDAQNRANIPDLTQLTPNEYQKLIASGGRGNLLNISVSR